MDVDRKGGACVRATGNVLQLLIKTKLLQLTICLPAGNLRVDSAVDLWLRHRLAHVNVLNHIYCMCAGKLSHVLGNTNR